MRLISRFMRFFYHHFYHSLAWTYDWVAAIVSIGRWNDWISTVIPFVRGMKILEIGHGPGHLQRQLRDQSPTSFGLDESMQMIRLAKTGLKDVGHTEIRLVRSLAQTLPFPEAEFDTVISTFPSEYIFDFNMLSEVYRILCDDGCFIVLPAAWIVGRKILDRAAAWLFQITGETPRNMLEAITEKFIHPLEQAGFNVESREIEIRSSRVLILVASKGR